MLNRAAVEYSKGVFDLSVFALPEDPAWTNKMLCRHAVHVIGPIRTAELPAVVERLDEYGRRWGMTRHGELSYESWDFGNRVGVASQFVIVDLQKFVCETERLARGKESERIRRLPWWRRLFMPKEPVA